MSLQVLNALDAIETHDMWIAATLLHPGFRALSFISGRNQEAFKRRGCAQIRKLMEKIQKTTDGTENEDVQEVAVSQGHVEDDLFNMNAAMDSPVVIGAENQDELARYFAHVVSGLPRSELSADFGCVQFWYINSGKCPVLSKVAYRVLATPPSSSSSERDFSDVHRILTPSRNCTAYGTVFDLIQIRSHYTNKSSE